MCDINISVSWVASTSYKYSIGSEAGYAIGFSGSLTKCHFCNESME
jgi:hypothetical protein